MDMLTVTILGIIMALILFLASLYFAVLEGKRAGIKEAEKIKEHEEKTDDK